jgi:short-subunit dehydrogenase
MYDFGRSTALVTGASSGLGERFALALAGRGADVVLVARRGDRLEGLADHIRGDHRRQATVMVADLARPGAGAALAERVTAAGITVDTLVNTAGFATHCRLLDEKPDRIDDEIALNVTTVVDLTHAFLPGMVARGRGAIVNIASTAAFQPVPSMAVYGASKAFVLSFTEAVAHETRGTGVRVLALCPGATDTEFFDVAGEAASVGRRQTPAEVVAVALHALDRRRTPPSIVPGVSNRIGTVLPRFLTRRAALAVVGRLTGAGA